MRPPGQAGIRPARALLGGALLVASVSGCSAVASTAASGPPVTSAAQRILVQAFTPHRAIRSGVIGLDLRVVPRGSATVAGPLELSFGGPVQLRGPGRVPAADFTVGFEDRGRRGSLALISAGGHAYVSIGGRSFRLPASSDRRLASSLGSIGSPALGPGGAPGALMLLGIDPLRWLRHTRIVGHPRLDGTPTTHVTARIDATALLTGLGRALRQAGSFGVSGVSTLAKGLSAVLPRRLARMLGEPRLDVWVGGADGMLRRVRLSAVMPVAGSMRAGLGGARSAEVTVSLRYRHLNQPQTITPPARPQAYSALRVEALLLLQQLEAGLTPGSSGTRTTGG